MTIKITEIAAYFTDKFKNGVEAKNINFVLTNELKYIQYSESNESYVLTERCPEELAKELPNKFKPGKTYIMWNDSIIEHLPLVKSLEEKFSKELRKIESIKKESIGNEKLILTSDFAKEKNKEMKDINKALNELKFQEYSESKGGYVLLKPFMGKNEEYLDKNKNKKTRILWKYDSLVNNSLILDKLKSFETRVKKYSKKEAEGYSSKETVFKFNRNFDYIRLVKLLAEAERVNDTVKISELKDRLSRYFVVTKFGTLVRSLGEKAVLNYFFGKTNKSTYEKKLENIEETVFSDFYVEFEYEDIHGNYTKRKIYIELWGFKTQKDYLKRKKEKLSLYDKAGVILVQLDYEDIAYEFDDYFNAAFIKHPDLDGLSFDNMVALDHQYSALKTINDLPVSYRG